LKVIGITGPTGAGKTTALNALVELGALIIDADAVYHDLTKNSEPMRKALTERFGPVYGPDGVLDRRALGAVVFQNPKALSDLNAITHHFVGKEIDRLLTEARKEGRIAAAIDAIALIESGNNKKCDVLVAVIAPVELRVRRIMAREGISEEYARMRVSAQKGEDFFRKNCDYILENDENDTPETFKVRALVLFRRILNL